MSIVDVSEPENEDPVRVVDVGAKESPAIKVADGPVNDPHLMQINGPSNDSFDIGLNNNRHLGIERCNVGATIDAVVEN